MSPSLRRLWQKSRRLRLSPKTQPSPSQLLRDRSPSRERTRSASLPKWKRKLLWGSFARSPARFDPMLSSALQAIASTHKRTKRPTTNKRINPIQWTDLMQLNAPLIATCATDQLAQLLRAECRRVGVACKSSGPSDRVNCCDECNPQIGRSANQMNSLKIAIDKHVCKRVSAAAV